MSETPVHILALHSTGAEPSPACPCTAKGTGSAFPEWIFPCSHSSMHFLPLAVSYTPK